jgi:hypothetical protein
MNKIQEAAENYLKKQLNVYQVASDRIIRDSRGAERSAKDHAGRWFFELLQNCDDARASKVKVVICNNKIYVGDNGIGLKPEAVNSLCGTDFSDKTGETIGRKGVGFKSVYDISNNPLIYTANEGGIEFSQNKTRKWMENNSLDIEYLPFQWLPFYIIEDDSDHIINDFYIEKYQTIVVLKNISEEQINKAKQLFKDFKPYPLLTFRYVREIIAPEFEITLSFQDDTWKFNYGNGDTSESWKIINKTNPVPEAFLEDLSIDEKRFLRKDGVNFLIAAPYENFKILPTSEYLPVHVFYPTEQNGPVRLLLHAEFLVKSDRTALIPIESSYFNSWVADRLADHICEFVNNSHNSESPSCNIALLLPFGERASHPVAEDLWKRIVDKAQSILQLTDIEGQQRLKISESKLISVSVRPDLVRVLLEATNIREQLLHPSFDNDKEAQKALRELGCMEIRDQDLIKVIAENAHSLTTNIEWVWTCWEWLAAWVAKEANEEERKKRVEQAKLLPVVPIEGRVVRASDLTSRIVTWKLNADIANLPEWIPLTFVEDWLRDRIENETENDSPVNKLTKDLEIKKPTLDVIQRALGKAIEQYWKDKHGDPGRFLRFILEKDWFETHEVSLSLRRCPVPLSKPVNGEVWGEASKAYFGSEWGNDLLYNLFAKFDTVAWVASDRIEGETENYRRILQWLGVADYPRVMQESGKTSVYQLPDNCNEWKKYLNSKTDLEGRRVSSIEYISNVNFIEISKLDHELSIILLQLLALNWNRYFRDKSSTKAEGCFSRERYYRYWQVFAKWWWEVCEYLPLTKRNDSDEHIALSKLWLPDKRTQQSIGSLLPILNIDEFGNNKDIVREWLIETIGLRSRLEQVTKEEWKSLLSNRIPERAPAGRLASEERLRDKVTRWYTTFLETASEWENVSEIDFSSCPLLCKKEDMWQYVANEPRYLIDDNDFATFAEDVWIFHIPKKLNDDAIKYFGIQRLSKTVNSNVKVGEPLVPLQNELNKRFRESLPYIWVWRSTQSKQDAEKLSIRLKELQVLIAPTLKASMSLNDIHHEVDRYWDVIDHTIYLQQEHANETELAQALAKLIKIRSEADFYENLFRCTDARQRKEKLLSKDIVDAEIDRCIREYSGSPTKAEYEEDSGESINNKQGNSISQIDSSSVIQRQQDNQFPAVKPDETSETTLSESSEREKPTQRLKDPNTTTYVLGSPPTGGTSTVSCSEGSSIQREGNSLTEIGVELENASRVLVIRELQNMGFSVEDMPQSNPGFDLRATKDGNELRVEVKAHSGRATIVDVTQREYKEYLSQQGYHWELWNVESLAENDPNQIVITRYNLIPDEALDTRTFRVDLRKCDKQQL